VKYFYDTEFIDDGHTLDLISIGNVAEDGREYYAISSDFSEGKLHSNKWLVDNVWPHLPLTHRDQGLGQLDRTHPDVRSRARIAAETEAFLFEDENPELWAWYAACDHVCLSQLWGRMIDLPAGIPMYTNDLKQECNRQGNPTLPAQPDGEHNALADARHNLVRAKTLGIVTSLGSTEARSAIETARRLIAVLPDAWMPVADLPRLLWIYQERRETWGEDHNTAVAYTLTEAETEPAQHDLIERP
jgi:hypothetical protein